MREAEFLQEIDRRLEENRRLAARTVLPKWLFPLASYLGFNAFRALFLVSLAVTLAMTFLAFEDMLWWGRRIFWFK